MTAAGERHRRLPTIARALLTAVALVAIAACTADPLPAVDADATGQQLLGQRAAVPAGDEQAIAHTIDRFNAAAAGPAADQQTLLTELVDPALVADLDRCPPVTATLKFEPNYPALRPAPGWTPRTGALGGTVYALPTLIRIYTGDRITGTDLTTLHLGVAGGEAFLTSLCLG